MRRALIVGIDHYPNGGSLTGCVADAVALADRLRTHADGAPNWRVDQVVGAATDPRIDRRSLRTRLGRLFEQSRGAQLLFFFAGHGARSPWGAELVTQDGRPNSWGVSMDDLVTLANDSPAASVTILLDCCFSGDTGDVPGLQSSGIAHEFRMGRAVLRENVTLLCASRPTEPSAEVGGHGAFTRVLLDGLDGAASDHRGLITDLSLYGFLSQAFDAWEQRPLLKTYLTEPTVLRHGPAWLAPEELRSLCRHFADETSQLRLTPEHEGENRPLPPGEPGTPAQQQFDQLARLRDAHLVASDSGRDHYWVAMNSETVSLTPLGRYYWRLAHRGLL